MNELSDRAKELLAAYREQAAPSAREHDLGLQRLLKRAARGDVAIPEYDVAPPELGAATGGGAGLGLKTVTALKWAAAGITTLGLAAAVVVGAGTGRPKAALPSSRPAPAQAAPPVSDDEPPAPAPALAPPTSLAPLHPPARVVPRGVRRKSAHAAASSAPGRGASAGVSAPVRVTEPAGPPPASPAAESPATRVSAPAAAEPVAEGVDAEMALMARALDAVKRGAFGQALTAVNAHAQRFPTGSLSETRDVTRVLALCGLGRRSEAARAAQQFLLARPHSPFASKVATACPTPLP